MRGSVHEGPDGRREAHLILSIDDRPWHVTGCDLPQHGLQLAVSEKASRAHALHLSDQALVQEAGTNLRGVPPAELVVDIEESLEKVSAIEAEHGFDVVLTAPAPVIGRRKCLFDLGLVETVQRWVALPVCEFE